MLDIKDKKVAVIGLSKRTGIATAKMLLEYGARVVISDIKGPEELKDELAMLDGTGVEIELNGHGERSLKSELIVVCPGIPLDIPFFQKVAQRGIPVISEIELAYHYTGARIIAITGTNGKTTTTGLLGNILEKAKPGKVKVAGNIGIPLIQEAVGLERDYWIVTEVSSFQLETSVDFHPAISLYLNFTPDHLDRHKTIENYWLAKKRIFKNQEPGDYALINIDDPEVVRAAEGCQAEIYSVSLKNEVKKGIYLADDKLIIRTSDDQQPVIRTSQIKLRGEHNRQNVAFAILAAYLAGADLGSIRDGIADFKPEGHRLEVLFEDDIVVVDDSKATNPDAAMKALYSFNKPIVLIAGGQDRKAEFSELARVIKERVRILILMGESRYKLRDEVLKTGFNNINIHVVENMQEAVQTAFNIINSGECLLLSPGCPSWDMYESYRERGNDFKSEVEILRGKLL